MTASPAHQLALYAGRSGTIAVGAVAVGPAGSSGGRAARARPARPGPAAAPARAVRWRDRLGGRDGRGGRRGARGAAATPAANSAVLLHSRVAAIRGKRLTIRYLAAKGTRLVLTRAPARRADRHAAGVADDAQAPDAAASASGTRWRPAPTRSCSRPWARRVRASPTRCRMVVWKA